MTGLRRKRILIGVATILVLLAAGTAGADSGTVKDAAAPPGNAQPPWLLLSGLAAVGTLAVGGVAVLWARMLERAGTVSRLR